MKDIIQFIFEVSNNLILSIAKGSTGKIDAVSPEAQRHLFHVLSTKGLRPAMYASMIGDQKNTILKFCSSAQQPGGFTKDLPKCDLIHNLSTSFSTFLYGLFCQ